MRQSHKKTSEGRSLSPQPIQERRKTYKRKLLASVIASSVAGVSGQAMAQDTLIEEVVVKGFKSSLIKAQGLKKNNTAIVEALTAEDIGKLPDSSIAESLARLPGLAGERRSGRTSGLSVRGFNENYVATTINGRETLGIGDNRGVEFDLYPSEIISNVVVYKTAEANLVNQGIGGTVDLRTTRPLGTDRVIAVNGLFESNEKGSGNPDMDDQGHRLAFNYSDSFADDTIGVAVAIASTESPSQEEQTRIWGYATVDGANVQSATNPDGGITLNNGLTAADVDGTVIPGGHDSYVRSSVLERNAISTVIEYAPSDDVRIALDVLSIDFEERRVFRGVEEGGPIWGTPTFSIDSVEDGLVTAGFVSGFRSVIRNDAEAVDGKLDNIGLNVDWNLNDRWALELDVARSETSKSIVNIESYSGVGRAGSATQGPGTSFDFALNNSGVLFTPTADSPDLSDPSLIRLAGPQPWGGALTPVPQFQGTNNAQDGFVNSPDFSDELSTFRLDLTGELDHSVISRVSVGLNYSDRTKSKVNEGAFITAPTYPNDGPIPEDFIIGNIDLSFVQTGESIIGYNSLGLLGSGSFTETPASRIETTRRGDTYTINEELLSAYVKADIETEISGIPVLGNFGVQVVNADQSATGFDAVIGPDLFVQATPTSGAASYTDILPSINLSFEIAEDQFVRFAAAKVQSRPRLDDMRPGSSISFQFNDANIQEPSDPQNSAWTAKSGNAELEPLETNQFDLSYEYYFGDGGLVALGAFYKDITNWHIAAQTVDDFTPFLIAGYHMDSEGNPPAFNQGIVNFREGGLTGSVTGYELQTQIPFNSFSETLDGFGIVASLSRNDGELEGLENDSLGGRIPGLSEESYQFTFYYERGGFEARVSVTDRDAYLTESRGLSLALTPEIDQGATLVDAQIGYNFADSGIAALQPLTITLQGQNLTNEATRLFDQPSGDSRRVTRYSDFGANYLLGIYYKF